mmetsp:Transcript_17581/g.24787  ORF Transcript_17581/g.24787 Transcript_17581/m.24787 type:complete len:300 (+) Transcript_17581:53-952(+)|eukprot:CAMPEP_0184862936 /NCGR_PEP_ID=MMETSP0580-20130426/8157_1 /TAXON_ID=1118495 /ORGANISM="Dactyliosolen fragilissimus" /LENGTH=299 /DNA_ID=CAMNT_0027360957 /DNA_START=42 /DNA_END=941 /DNA_ORIENTATION=+
MKFSITILATLSSAQAFSIVQNVGHSFVTSGSTLYANRQPIMAGNWKMNPATEDDAVALASGLTTLLGEETCPMDEENEFCTEVVVFPPHPFLSKVKSEVDEVGITVGAQSIFFEDKGAYTGSVAASMVKSIGCEYVLCGHSERRTMFNDSDDAINRKVRKVIEAGMKPILCIGETKEEYDLKIKNEVCAMQLSKDLLGVTKEQMKDVVIAYEPVWAIGTGLVCGAEDANEVHVFLRSILASLYDDDVAQKTRIQYGGSVTPDSVDELMAQPDIDGCLVGGASLDAEKFSRIINFKKSD